jgi:hypothetical protein
MDPFTIPAIGWGVSSALGWVVSPIISKLLTQGFDYLGYDTAKKLGQLEPKLLVLERVMEVVDRSPYRPRLEQLFKELKTAFYEAEEILDAVEYHCLERQIQDAKLQSAGAAPPRKRDRMKKIRSAMAKVSFLKIKVFSFLPFVLSTVSPSKFVVPIYTHRHTYIHVCACVCVCVCARVCV